MRSKFFPIALLLTLLVIPCALADSSSIIQQSANYTAKSAQPQRFMDFINLSNGQETLPLTLTIQNGTKKAPRYNWIRVSVGGNQVLAEDNFNQKTEATCSLAGQVASGENQIIVDAGGQPGSILYWLVTAPSMQLTSIDPKEAYPGTKVTLKGSGFDPVAANDTVSFGGTKASAISATATSIDTQIPANLNPGDTKVTVTSNKTTSAALTIKIKAPPELTSTDWMAIAPSMNLVITGKNFAKNPNDNQVLFGDVPATIIEGSTTSLTVVVPEMANPQFKVPITVKIGNVKSKNSIDIDIQNRAIPQ